MNYALQKVDYKIFMACRHGTDGAFTGVGNAQHIAIRHRHHTNCSKHNSVNAHKPIYVLWSCKTVAIVWHFISKDDNGMPNKIAFVWMDRDRSYFIASNAGLPM